MKLLSLIAIAGIFLMAGCAKHGVSAAASLSGTWELYKVSGGFTVNYPPGNGDLLKFSGDTYQKYSSGALIKNGKFAIIYDTTATASTCHIFPAGQFANRIVFDTATNSSKVFFDITGNTLTLVSGCFAVDAGSFSYYTKK